jgi:hypothetical protein
MNNSYSSTSFGSFGGIPNNTNNVQYSNAAYYNGGYSGLPYYVTTPGPNMFFVAPIPETKKEEKMEQKTFSAKTLGVQIIYRFGNSEVKTQTLKGVSDLEKAQELFLDQFGPDDAEPEIVAAVEVLVGY